MLCVDLAQYYHYLTVTFHKRIFLKKNLLILKDIEEHRGAVLGSHCIVPASPGIALGFQVCMTSPGFNNLQRVLGFNPPLIKNIGPDRGRPARDRSGKVKS
jgi:hypothetical protein